MLEATPTLAFVDERPGCRSHRAKRLQRAARPNAGVTHDRCHWMSASFLGGYDHERAGCVMGTLLADRAEEQLLEPTVPTCRATRRSASRAAFKGPPQAGSPTADSMGLGPGRPCV